MSFIRFWLPFLFRQPKAGDQYVHESDSTNPFDNRFPYTVIEIKRGWVKLSYGSFGSTRSIRLRSLIAFYVLYKPST